MAISSFPSGNLVNYSQPPRQCSGISGKMCNHFVLFIDNDSHEICSSCSGKTCTKEHCAGTSEEKWEKVRAYLDELAIQSEKKRERKACFKSCSSFFFGFSSSCQIPILVSLWMRIKLRCCSSPSEQLD